MDKYFIVKKHSQLYIDFSNYLKDSKKVNDAFKVIAKKYGIEAKEYYPTENLGIVCTKSDYEKFKSQLKKDSGFFKVNSIINKDWKENTWDVEYWHKPNPARYLSKFLYGKHKTRLFFIDDILYGSIESTEDISAENWMQELKASEFHKAIEEYEER